MVGHPRSKAGKRTRHVRFRGQSFSDSTELQALSGFFHWANVSPCRRPGPSGRAPQAVDARPHAVAVLHWLEGDALPSHHQAVVLRHHVAIRHQAPALRPPSARAGAFRRQRRSLSAEHAEALRGNGIEGRNASGPADAASSGDVTSLANAPGRSLGIGAVDSAHAAVGAAARRSRSGWGDVLDPG